MGLLKKVVGTVLKPVMKSPVGKLLGAGVKKGGGGGTPAPKKERYKRRKRNRYIPGRRYRAKPRPRAAAKQAAGRITKKMGGMFSRMLRSGIKKKGTKRGAWGNLPKRMSAAGPSRVPPRRRGSTSPRYNRIRQHGSKKQWKGGMYGNAMRNQRRAGVRGTGLTEEQKRVRSQGLLNRAAKSMLTMGIR